MQILNLKVEIPWASIEPGMSFFVPCLDTENAVKQLTWEAGRYRYRVICKQVIEGDRYGLRCWRVE
jgi:hypothetical protein